MKFIAEYKNDDKFIYDVVKVSYVRLRKRKDREKAWTEVILTRTSENRIKLNL